MRKFLKSAMAILLAAVLLTGNNGYAQAAQEQLADTITKSVVSETVLASQVAGTQQSRAVVQAKSKKSTNAAYNKKAKKAYKKFLKGYFEKGKAFAYDEDGKTKIKWEWTHNFSENGGGYYVIYDINNDGKLELILNTEDICGMAIPSALFIYYKGKVKCIGITGHNSYYCGYRKGNLILGGEGGMGEFYFYYYKIKNGKLKKVASSYDNAGMVDGETIPHVQKYWIGKKKVSKKKFDNFIKKNTGSKNPKIINKEFVKYK